MKASCLFPKSLAVSLSLVILLVMANQAHALYFFEWKDSGQEWCYFCGDVDLTANKADKWKGYFTLPDSAVTDGNDFSNDYPYGYHYVKLDLTKYLDFSLTGKLASGNYMEATAFHGTSFYTPQRIDSQDIVLDNFYGEITYVMANPSWMNTPLYLTIYGDDYQFYYPDMINDTNTNSMLSAYIYHDGVFVGHHINDSASPTPEPATILLFGAGLVGVFGARSRKKKK